MKNPRRVVLIGLIVLAALSRVLPHPPNFTPLGAIGLFAGAKFERKSLAFLVAFASLFLSDCFLGFHALMPVIYGLFAMSVVLGRLVQRYSINAGSLAYLAAGNAVIFFVLSNFAVWVFGSGYPKTLEGLVLCFTAAIPFFQNTVAGDLIYTMAIFGLWHGVDVWLRDQMKGPASNLVE